MKLPLLGELRNFIQSADLPFFIKGALSVQDAVKCVELGCAGVILNHHNGIMRCAVPPVRLLPKIREAVGQKLILIADGGMESGFDVFKELALGADAVTVGRPLMEPLKEKGAAEVRDVLETMTRQLQVMVHRTALKRPESHRPVRDLEEMRIVPEDLTLLSNKRRITQVNIPITFVSCS